MSDTKVNSAAETRLSMRQLLATYLRFYLVIETSNSFERMQANAFCITMAPHLKRWYKDNKPAYIEGLKRHLQFYNSEPTIGAIIPGIVLSLEEKKAAGENVPDEVISGIKTGLMGPMAGIGDSLIQSTVHAIIGALACSVALTGNIAGGFIPILFPLIAMIIGFNMMCIGYNVGRDAVTKLMKSGLFNKVIVATGILSMFMIGALSASYVTVSTPLQFVAGNAENLVVVQDVLDSIIPGLLPLTAVLAVYRYFARGGERYGRVVAIMMAISILGSIIGIL